MQVYLKPFFKDFKNVIVFSELCMVFDKSAPSSDYSNNLQMNRYLKSNTLT